MPWSLACPLLAVQVGQSLILVALSLVGLVTSVTALVSSLQLLSASEMGLAEAEVESIDILQEALAQPESYVLERADARLESGGDSGRWPSSMEEFTCLDESTSSLKVCLTRDGRMRQVTGEEDQGIFQSLVQMVEEKIQPRHRVLQLQVPGTNLLEQASITAGEKILLRVFSEDTPAAEPVVRRASPDEVLEHVLGFLQIGAESVNLVLGYEMLQLKYDKMDVVEDAEHRAGRPWIVTHYAWGPVRHFKLWPAPDPLQKYLDQMADSKRNAYQVQQQILKQLRRQGSTPEEVERFLERTGGEGSDKGLVDAKSDRLLRMMAKQATTRGFWVQATDEAFHPLDGNRPREDRNGRTSQPQTQMTCPPLPPRGVHANTVEQTMKALVKQMGLLAGDPKNWQLLIDWEPHFAKTMKDSLHEAQRLRMMGDEAGHARMALKTVELMEKMTLQQRLGTAKLNNTEPWRRMWNFVSSDSDPDCTSFRVGAIPRDRFEKLLEQHCKRVIGMVEGTLLPMAEHNKDLERQVMWRERGYMYFWLPRARQLEDDIVQTYRRAAEMAQQLHPKHVIGSSVFVNLACFYAECQRDTEMAITVCKEGKSYLVLLELIFDEAELEQHKEALGSAWDEDEAPKPEAPPKEELRAAWAAARAPEGEATGAKKSTQLLEHLASAMRPNLSTEQRKECKAVLRWLRRSVGRFRCTCSTRSCTQDKDSSEVITQIRWVQAVEMPNASVMHPVMTRGRGGAEKTFLVACVVRVNPKAFISSSQASVRKRSSSFGERRSSRSSEGEADRALDWGKDRRDRRLEDALLKDDLMKSLAQWPSKPNETLLKSLRVESGELLAELGLMLTDDGVANRPVRLALDKLNAGGEDGGPLEGHSPCAGVRLLREGRIEAPVTLTFLRSMKVKNTFLDREGKPIVASCPYCDCHPNFVGWRDRASNLSPSGHFQSLAGLAEEFAEEEDLPTFSWDADGPPPLPESPEEMAQQAADAVMRAYRDGKTRQTGIQALQMATTPFMEGLSKKLWGGDFFKDVKTSVVDDQAGTLSLGGAGRRQQGRIYRESDNEMQDMAMFYLPGRDLMAEQKTQNFIRRMKDRLVLLVNTENAQSFFRVDFKGSMVEVHYTNMGKEISNIFQEQTYYYDKAPCQSWQMTTFRAYPYNWEVYIEDLDYNLVKVWDSEPWLNSGFSPLSPPSPNLREYKPTTNQIEARLEQYEKVNGIEGKAYKKMAKIMKELLDTPSPNSAPRPRSEAWPPGSDEEEPDFEASARQSLQLQCQDRNESLTRLRQEIADAGTREQRLKELLRCRSRSLVRLASQLTRAQDQRRPTDRGLFHVEVQTEVPTLDAIDPEAALPTVTSRPAQRVVELAASSPAVRDMVLQRLKEDFLNLCQFAVATQKWGHTAQRCNAQSFESRHATPVLAPPWLMLAPHVVGAAAAGRRFPVGRRAFAAVPVPEVLRRLRWLHSPGQVLRLAAKNEGADMVVLCALLQRLVYLAKQDGGSKETELSQDGRFQVLLKTLSSRVESCDGGTLARLADAAARLPRSAEALLPHVGRLSDPEVSRLLFALALSNPDWQGKWQTVKQVLAAQYVAGSTRNLPKDVLRLLDTHATSAVDVPRSVLVMLHEVCSYVACHGLHSELAVQWRSAAEETNKEEVERWARSGSPLRAQVHRALMPDPGFQGPVAWLCGFSVDFLNQRSKTVIDLDHISWPTSPTLRHLLLKEKGYRTDARPVGCEDLTDGQGAEPTELKEAVEVTKTSPPLRPAEAVARKLAQQASDLERLAQEMQRLKEELKQKDAELLRSREELEARKVINVASESLDAESDGCVNCIGPPFSIFSAYLDE
eukprot:g2546.t1